MIPSGFSTATGYPARPPESGKMLLDYPRIETTLTNKSGHNALAEAITSKIVIEAHPYPMV